MAAKVKRAILSGIKLAGAGNSAPAPKTANENKGTKPVAAENSAPITGVQAGDLSPSIPEKKVNSGDKSPAATERG
jgi:hypothetical protein